MLEALNPSTKALGLLDDSLLKWLQAKRHSGRLINQHIPLPAGDEAGVFAVLDFGGSNVRAGIVALDGKRGCRVLHTECAPLRGAAYDMTRECITAEELFAFAADILVKALTAAQSNKAISGRDHLLLGHVFSFPCRQTGINSAELLKWTKEIRTKGVVGHDVQQLLSAALQKKGVGHITPSAVLNDTTAVLLAGHYQYGHTALAGIIGTGHNFGGFIQTDSLRASNETSRFIAHNFESGDFIDIPPALLTALDTELDRKSNAPKEQLLEKMIGGAYLGEIGRLAFSNAAEEIPEFAVLDFLPKAYSLSTPELAMLTGCSNIALAETWLSKHKISNPSLNACLRATAIADSVIRRAARITAAEISAFLACHFLVTYEKEPSIVALEGSLYLKAEFFRKCLFQSLCDEFHIFDASSRIISMPDAVFVGAAVAACMGGRR